jgi:hypothetical protein
MEREQMGGRQRERWQGHQFEEELTKMVNPCQQTNSPILHLTD